MGSQTNSEAWVVCPICGQPNPAGTEYCKHCWGAAIGSARVVPSNELEGVLNRVRARIKRRRLTKLLLLTILPVLLTAAIAFSSVYFLTDLIDRPLATISSDSVGVDWAMFRHDLSRTGAIGATTGPLQGNVRWSFSAGAGIHSSPAVVGGVVYFGARDSKVYAIDAATGQERWTFTAESWIESSPAVVSGVIYIGSNDGHLYALDASTGRKLWAFNTNYPVTSSPAVANGVVYVGSDNYHFYALDARTGRELWDFNATSQVMSSPAVSGGIVYFGSGSDYFYALNATNGHLRLHFKPFNSVIASPAITGDTVYFGNTSGLVFAVNGEARSKPLEHFIRPFWIQAWAMGFAPRPPQQSGLIWQMNLDDATNSSPIIAGDLLYIASGNDFLAINRQNGKQQWKVTTGGLISSSPSLGGNAVYVASEDGHLYGLDATTGRQLWDMKTGDKITSSPALADGTLYVGSWDGTLYAIQ